MIDLLTQNIDNEWLNLLKGEFAKPYFSQIFSFLQSEKKKGKEIYPKEKDIFNALKLCKFENTKVIIIGQDPYHGHGQANGLCFSVNKEIKIPPSLRNIYKALNKEYGYDIPNNGDLTNWAKQGVLMLNTYLTVEKGLPASHQKIGWGIFTHKVIELLSTHKTNLVFLLWGKHAFGIEPFINPHNQHLILKSAHPSPFSAYRGFFGNNHFKQCNQFLKQNKMAEINWEINNIIEQDSQQTLF